MLSKYGVEIEALHFLCGCYTCNRYRLASKFSFGVQSPIGRLPLLWFWVIKIANWGESHI